MSWNVGKLRSPLTVSRKGSLSISENDAATAGVNVGGQARLYEDTRGSYPLPSPRTATPQPEILHESDVARKVHESEVTPEPPVRAELEAEAEADVQLGNRSLANDRCRPPSVPQERFRSAGECSWRSADVANTPSIVGMVMPRSRRGRAE